MRTCLFICISFCGFMLGGVAAMEEGVETDRLSRHIEALSSDAFEGRGVSSKGEDLTVDYLVEAFRAAGLSPGGDMEEGRQLWTQSVPMIRTSFNNSAPISIELITGGHSQMLMQGNEIAIQPSQTGAEFVDISKAPLVFLGYGVKAPERDWDDFKGIDLRGKVGIVFVNDPDFETGQGDFGGKAMTYYGRWPYKYEEAARQGALGLLIVHEDAPATYGWSTVKNSRTSDQYDVVRSHPETTDTPLQGWIQRDLAKQIFQAAGHDFDALKTVAQTREFRPIELPGMSLSARFSVQHQSITSKNVIGILRGSKKPEEYVVYSAHWDHLGIGKPNDQGDNIYNGAVDNGTGLAALLEIARLQAKSSQTARSLVFLAPTAEEKGLLGSTYYTEHPPYPLAKTAAVFNFDALNVAGRSRDISPFGNGNVSLETNLAVYAKRIGRTFKPDPLPEAGLFFRSDHFPFAKVGVPALSLGFDAAPDLLEGGAAAGMAWHKEFVGKRYHQPDDEWNPDWDLSGLAEDIGLILQLSRDVANSDDWPSWNEGSEFKAVRDTTAVERP